MANGEKPAYFSHQPSAISHQPSAFSHQAHSFIGLRGASYIRETASPEPPAPAPGFQPPGPSPPLSLLLLKPVHVEPQSQQAWRARRRHLEERERRVGDVNIEPFVSVSEEHRRRA